ncbi:ribonuclease HII [Candidatus Saccharibacteria bacterium]|nr:MAG: ribonuclease HII [Candidatus Saccharibacteria bacterium]
MVTVGLDEVGRGCWAGPLVAAAVAMNDQQDIVTGLRDSKKLSKKQRERLDSDIRSQVKAYGVGWVAPSEIDSLGLTQSVQLAMLRAMNELNKTCPEYDEIIIDGNYNFLANCERLDLAHNPQGVRNSKNDVRGLTYHNVRTMVGADDKVPAVSAASIIAKVARDTYMCELAIKYPEYLFEKHVGYGTAAHAAALKKHGVTDEHRTSFAPIRALIPRSLEQ